LSYLAIARAAESRMRMARDPGAALADLYRKYWTTPESESVATFTALLEEIATLEGQFDPGEAIVLLEAAAKRFHQETGVCPFCRFTGPLHPHGEPDGQDRLL